MHDITYSTFEF